MNTLDYFKEHFEELQSGKGSNGMGQIRQHAFEAFNKMGIPTSRHEEWKYTRIGNVFNTQYQLSVNANKEPIPLPLIQGVRLPGHEKANELFFVNGIFSFAHSTIRSGELIVLPLEEAAKNEYGEFVRKYFGSSGQYIKDGINALNTAFMNSAVFIHVKKGKLVRHPIYIYNITDASSTNILAQPRSLVHIGENSSAQIVETYATIGSGENFTNQVMEIIVEKDAMLEYYKIQNDAAHANQVSTTHIRQTGKSHVHTVTISLNGAIVRNNLNILMESEYSEAHLYGLYFMQGRSHIDNHTLVDNIKPNCMSNELYKGIMDDTSTGVFNGKVFVRPLAQKTNAYQSNKNVLVSDAASVNTKPQLEIFADDVKCSHGCTVGQLNEEGLFYLQSRGISGKMAKSILLHAFATDILEKIKPEPIRAYVDQLISQRLEFNL